MTASLPRPETVLGAPACPAPPRPSRGPSVAASEPGGDQGRRPEAAALRPRTVARAPSPGPGRPPTLLAAAEGPRKSPPRWVLRQRAVPSFLPRGLGRSGVDAGPRAGPAPGTPCSPISPSSSSSSSCSMSNRTSLVIICIAPPKAAPNLARSWGSRVPERRGSRGPGARVGTAGRVSLPAQGPLHQPAPRKAEPRRPPIRTQRPRLPLATEHAQRGARLAAE